MYNIEKCSLDKFSSSKVDLIFKNLYDDIYQVVLLESISFHFVAFHEWLRCNVIGLEWSKPLESYIYWPPFRLVSEVCGFDML